MLKQRSTLQRLKIPKPLWAIIFLGVLTVNIIMAKNDTEAFDVQQKEKYFGIIRGIEIGDSLLPKIIFIHGSPGSGSNFLPFIKKYRLWEEAHILLIDRMGYGGSEKKKAMTLENHSSLIAPALNDFCAEQKCILVGHSYGGAVVLKLMTQMPERIKSALLLAPCISPKHQKKRWYNSVANWFFVNPIIGKNLRNSNEEMIELPEALEKIKSDLQKIQSKIIYVQGEEDWIVKPDSYHYASQVFQNNSQAELKLYPNMGHLILWKNQDVFYENLKKCF